MALPKIATPVYTASLPSTGVNVTFRPFLVKEEKALLLAQQTENAATILESVRGVIDACTFEKLDMNALSMLDLEFLFVRIRAKSVGETQPLIIRCTATPGCSGHVEKTVNLETDVTSVTTEGHTRDIRLTDSVGIRLRYPTVQTSIGRLTSQNFDETDMLIDCIECVWEGDTLTTPAEVAREELVEFLGNLTDEHFRKIQHFFDTMPYMGFHTEFDCPACGKHNVLDLRGIENFF